MSSRNQQKLVCPEDRSAGEETETILNYTGPSMNPTLRVGDGMTVIPYGNSKIRVGDVVVFRSPEQDHYVVHRVISVDPQGVRTIGDNNNSVDPWVLSADDIVGRVVSARRRNRDVTIHGGTRGRLLLPVLQIVKRIKLTVFKIFRPAYNWLARSGAIRRVLSPLIRTQLLCFKRPNGVEIQLLMGQRIIARRLPGTARWQIRRPFRLFVDENSLPEEDVPHSTIPESNLNTDAS